jgi:hypothetical protein
VRGTDTLGNQLIYDTDFDITWYDYTNSNDTWDNQVAWADALTVDFDGTIYDDWRLPISDETCHDYDCTGSEMGHPYYTELGNVAGGPLTNTGPFANLQPNVYIGCRAYFKSILRVLLLLLLWLPAQHQ